MCEQIERSNITRCSAHIIKCLPCQALEITDHQKDGERARVRAPGRVHVTNAGFAVPWNG